LTKAGGRDLVQMGDSVSFLPITWNFLTRIRVAENTEGFLFVYTVFLLLLSNVYAFCNIGLLYMYAYYNAQYF
jgi:hypothetical protein